MSLKDSILVILIPLKNYVYLIIIIKKRVLDNCYGMIFLVIP